MKYKMIVLVILLVSIKSFAGNEAGGGGHPCKRDFFNTVMSLYYYRYDLRHEYHANVIDPLVMKVYDSALFVMSPGFNPSITIEIVDSKITNCPHTDNPVACSWIKQNKIQVYCPVGSNEGWNSLSILDKQIYAIHELLWWTEFDDRNFYYSEMVVSELSSANEEKIHRNNACHEYERAANDMATQLLSSYQLLQSGALARIEYFRLSDLFHKEVRSCSAICAKNQSICLNLEMKEKMFTELEKDK